MSHVITIQPPFDGSCIFLCCSCSDEPIAKVGFPEAPASLVEINEIAHRHIEVSERYDVLRANVQAAWGPLGEAKWSDEPAELREIRPAFEHRG